VTEYFAEGTVPTESCDLHTLVKVCNVSGMLASPLCTSTSDQVYIKKPAEDVLNPEDAANYEVADAEYCVTDEFLSTFCTTHTAVNILPGSSTTPIISGVTGNTGSVNGTTNGTTGTTNGTTGTTNGTTGANGTSGNGTTGATNGTNNGTTNGSNTSGNNGTTSATTASHNR
jgi:penicillin-binding protein 1A